MPNPKTSVLLVEDNILAMKMGRIILEELNCEVDTAKTGMRAIEKIKQTAYQLILIDIGLPDIDGLSIVDVMRSTENPNKDSVVIILTAHIDKDYHEESLRKGATDYFFKPLSLELGKTILKKYA